MADERNVREFTAATAIGIGTRGNVTTRLLNENQTTAEEIQNLFPLWIADQKFILVVFVRSNEIVHYQVVRSEIVHA